MLMRAISVESAEQAMMSLLAAVGRILLDVASVEVDEDGAVVAAAAGIMPAVSVGLMISAAGAEMAADA
jgi:hypothetical protein